MVFFLRSSFASFLAPSSPIVFCIFRVWRLLVVRTATPSKLAHSKISFRPVIAITGHFFVATPRSESQQFMTDPLILVGLPF
jgi:hypothetical protein